jgi:hypothetical protein
MAQMVEHMPSKQEVQKEEVDSLRNDHYLWPFDLLPLAYYLRGFNNLTTKSQTNILSYWFLFIKIY